MRVVIVGAGFGAFCTSVELLRRFKGDADFELIILEKRQTVGGVWAHGYPGQECDVESYLYSVSYAPHDWVMRWSSQAEIQTYIERIYRDFGVMPHVRFGSEVVEALWDVDALRWTVHLRDGAPLSCDFVVFAVGQLSLPQIPLAAEKRAAFGAPQFHTAEFDHSVPLDGLRVAVIGNGSSAAQLVPQLQPRVAELHVFWKTPNWIWSKGQRRFSWIERMLLGRIPGAARVYRGMLRWMFDAVSESSIAPGGIFNRLWRYLFVRDMRARLGLPAAGGDAALEALIPPFPPFAKRTLIEDGYLEAIRQPNVQLRREYVIDMRPGAVVAESGEEVAVDAVVWATGFRTTEFLEPIRVRTSRGLDLHEEWRKVGGAEAFLSIVPFGEFPNLLLSYGPNSNLGTNSIIIMLECQARFQADLIALTKSRRMRAFAVKREAYNRYDHFLREALDKTVWGARDVNTWYRAENGKLTQNWCGNTRQFERMTRRANPSDFDFFA